MKTITRNLSISLALLGGVALAPQALAGEGYALAFDPAEVRSVEDMQRLHAEIRSVAKDYCPTYQEARSFQVVNSCRKMVSTDLVSRVGQPAFTAFVEGQSRQATPALIAAND